MERFDLFVRVESPDLGCARAVRRADVDTAGLAIPSDERDLRSVWRPRWEDRFFDDIRSNPDQIFTVGIHRVEVPSVDHPVVLAGALDSDVGERDPPIRR